MHQYVIFAFTIVLVASQVYGQDEYYGEQESDCIQQGGLCIIKSECKELIGEPGELCPKQAEQGYLCCAGLPISETRCRMHGGECFDIDYCKDDRQYSDASDCGADQECCILEK